MISIVGGAHVNKKELVAEIAEKADVTKKLAGEVLDNFIETVEEQLSKGEEVKLVGFGTFEVRKAAARTGVNPRTRQKIKIPARKVPKFKPGKDLKECVNK